jgi:hypothetical protein
MQDYPTRFGSEGGESIWLTRLKASDSRATSAYEWRYGHWVPGNPFDALIAVFVFTPESAASTLLNSSDCAGHSYRSAAARLRHN